MAIGLRLWTRGRKIGLPRGTKPTTCILITPAMGTTYMTACILASGSQSLSRFNRREGNYMEPLEAIFSDVRGRRSFAKRKGTAGPPRSGGRKRRAVLFRKVYLRGTR